MIGRQATTRHISAQWVLAFNFIRYVNGMVNGVLNKLNNVFCGGGCGVKLQLLKGEVWITHMA